MKKQIILIILIITNTINLLSEDLNNNSLFKKLTAFPSDYYPIGIIFGNIKRVIIKEYVHKNGYDGVHTELQLTNTTIYNYSQRKKLIDYEIRKLNGELERFEKFTYDNNVVIKHEYLPGPGSTMVLTYEYDFYNYFCKSIFYIGEKYQYTQEKIYNSDGNIERISFIYAIDYKYPGDRNKLVSFTYDSKGREYDEPFCQHIFVRVIRWIQPLLCF